MRLHYIQHVEFEGLANIQPWAEENGWKISATHLYRGEKLPAPDDLDWLIVMGGPMNVYEEREYPWLASEKIFIRSAIEKNKIVLGICLGAQLIACVSGAKVFPNKYKEIGWFPVDLLQGAADSPPFRHFPNTFMAFHWHGDTFDLPPEATMLASSEACSAQAFSLNRGRVVGLQFHLESSQESVQGLIQNCSDELVEGEYIQRPDDILEKKEFFSSIHQTMLTMLKNIKSMSHLPRK